MSGSLPLFLDLARPAPQVEEFALTLALASLPRLAAVLADSAGEAEIRLRVERAPGAATRVRGEVRARLTLVCQRCLGRMTLPVASSLHLVWVRNDAQAAALAATEEPLLSETGRVAAAALVEEELLLALPSVPRHAETECCAAPALRWLQVRPQAPGSATNRRPFAMLADLKRPR